MSGGTKELARVKRAAAGRPGGRRTAVRTATEVTPSRSCGQPEACCAESRGKVRAVASNEDA